MNGLPLNKVVVLTGATGYLGSRLAHDLNKSYEIIVLKRSTSNLKYLQIIKNDLTFYDIDKIEMESIFTKHKVDIVIHTATDYGRSGSSSSDIVKSNLMFPIHLLDLAIQNNVPTFINTDTVLEKYTNLYALSKKQFLEHLKYQSHLIQIINLELEHFYGPDDSETKFITNMIKKMLLNVDSIPLTSGLQKRNFIYIDDVVEAYVLILKNLEKLDLQLSEFTIGYKNNVSIKTLLEQIKSLTKSKSKLHFGEIEMRVNELLESKKNPGEINLINWKCKTSLLDGLHKTIQFDKIKLGKNR